MSVKTPVSVPSRIRVDVRLFSLGFSASQEIVHVGQSALLFQHALSGPLLTLTGSSGGVVPDGISVPNAAEFERVRTEVLSMRERRTRPDFSEWIKPGALIAEKVDLLLSAHPIAPTAVERMRLEAARLSTTVSRRRLAAMNPEPVRALAPQLAERALAGGPIAGLLRSLVGAGPGTTPTGDDVIVGVMAGLSSLGQRGPLAAITAALPPLLPRTTSASRHYLRAARRGHFAEHVHDLVRSLADPSLVLPAVKRAAGWGSTSGLDLTTGLVAVLREARSRTIDTERIA